MFTTGYIKTVIIAHSKSVHRIMALSHLRILVTILATIIMVVVFLTILMPIWLLVFVYRSVVWTLARVSRPDLESFVTKQNALSAVYPPTTPHSSINIVNFFILKGQLTTDRIRQLFKERVLNKRDRRNRLIYMRLQQFWTSFLGYAFWKTDENFSLDLHVREYDYKGELYIPHPCQRNDILKLSGKLITSPWAENRSPWEILVVNNFIDEGYFEASTCLIIKIDHVLCDGYSIVNLMEQLFSMKVPIPNIRSNQKKFTFLEKLGLVFRIPYDLVDSLVPVLCSKRVFQNKLSREVICSLSPPVPVSLIKDIKNYYKVSYAAVLQCAIQGVLGRALTSARMAVPKNLSCQYILPIRNHPGGIVCHFNIMPLTFSCEGPTAVDRLYKMEKTLKSLSNSTAAVGMLDLMLAFAHFPIIVRRYYCNAMSSFGLSYSVSNFPAITSQQRFDGLELTQLMVFTDMGMYQMGITIASAGTNSKQVFNFSTDKNIFGSEEIANSLGSLILEELQDLAREMV